MKGLILSAGRNTRLGDLSDKHNKTLLDLGGETLLGNILNHFESVGITETAVVVGFDAPTVRSRYASRATFLLNPFFEHYGILGSLWQARSQFLDHPFVITTGDHYFSLSRFQAFLQDQPEADILVDVELKSCDDEDMKVYLNRAGMLQTMSKTLLGAIILGEFTATVRFSADGSAQFFDTLDKYVWQHGIQGYLADVLCTHHRKWPLAFHLSQDHHRVEVDYPCDLAKARQLFAQQRNAPKKTG